MIKRILQLAGISIFFTLIVVIFFFTTEPGLRTLLYFNNQFTSTHITYKSLRGRLNRHVELTELHIETPYSTVDIKDFTLDWRPWLLVSNRIPIKSLILKNIHLQVPHILNRRFEKIELVGVLHWSSLEIKKFLVTHGPYHTDGAGVIDLYHPYQTHFTMLFSSTASDLFPLLGKILITGNKDAIHISGNITAPFKINFAGDLKEFTTAPHFYLTGDWQHVYWPLSMPATLHSNNGHFILTGTMQDYFYKVSSDLASENIPAGDWSIAGHGNQSTLYIDDLNAYTLSGMLKGKGKLSWQPELRWEFSLTGKAINPQTQWSDWPGKLHFSLLTQGSYLNESLNYDVELVELGGELRGYPILGHAKLVASPSNLQIEDLSFTSGNAKLLLSGQINQTLNLNWNINIPQLSKIIPNGQGSLHSIGLISGTRDQPKVNASILGENITADNTVIKQLEGKIQLDFSHETPINISIHGNNIHLQQYQINKILLEVSGNHKNHTITFSLVEPKQSVSLKAQGSLNQLDWSGAISAFNLDSNTFGNWILENTASVTLSPTKIKTAPICLRKNSEQVCFDGEWLEKKPWHGTVTTKELSTKPFFNALLPNTLQINSKVNSQISFQPTATGQIQGSANIKLDDGNLTYVLQNKLQTLAINQGTLQITLDQTGTRATADLSVAHDQTLHSSFELPGFNSLHYPEPTQKIHGKVDIHFTQFDLLPLFITYIEDSGGKFNLTATVNGSLEKPQIQGEGTLTEGEVKIPTLGIGLTDISLKASGDNQGIIHYIGSATSNQGTLNYTGKTAIFAEGYPTQLSVTGHDVEILNTYEYHLFATPTLTINVKKPRVDIIGTIDIPNATLAPQDFSQTLELPSDVNIIEPDDGSKERPWEIWSDLLVNLGENVSINFFGLTGKLDGSLRITDTPKQATKATGEIRILQGKYRAYGQNLSIRRGFLTYSGGSIDNPGINLQAVKSIKSFQASNLPQSSPADLKSTSQLKTDSEASLVGINVSGTLQDPRYKLFAEPANLNQSDILSYLLIGVPISEASGSQGAAVINAISVLPIGGSQSAHITDEIQDFFGLDQLGFETSQLYLPDQTKPKQNTALVAGKYLTPQLFVSYSTGLVVPIQTLRVRYNFNKHWSVQTESNTNDSGGDILFHIDTN